MNTFTKDAERFLYLHERILFRYFLKNFSLGDRYNKQSFLGLTVTYVNTDYQYKVINLLCRSFNGKRSYDLVHEVSWKKFPKGQCCCEIISSSHLLKYYLMCFSFV